MRYAIGIPLIVKENPIGILWGIKRKKLTEDQKRDLTLQLHTLFDVKMKNNVKLMFESNFHNEVKKTGLGVTLTHFKNQIEF